MADSRSVSFRAQTTGAINDLLIAEDVSNAKLQNLLVYFAGALLNYKDEGVEFSPNIVICHDVGSFLQSFPGPVSYEIGTVPFEVSSGAQILKDCAPLSGSKWSIYIEQKASTLTYGVFSYFQSPTAVTLEDSMSLSSQIFAILVRRSSLNTIEMRGAKGNSASFLFSTVLDPTDERPPIKKFCTKCVSEIAASDTLSDFYMYFVRLVEVALSNSHGTILVCMNKKKKMTAIPSMKDAVPLKPTLDFFRVFAEYQRQKSADSILDLQRCEELLFGFMKCDGIVAFDTSGQVRAYRVFFKSSTKGDKDVGPIVGGARRRAFEGLKKLGKEHLLAVLFRSQDGTTIHHEAA